MSKKTPNALRYNANKPQMSLIFDSPKPMIGLAEVLEYGTVKYNRGNWMNGFEPTQISDSLIRHLMSYLGGEDIDPESGLPHVGHIMANALFLSDGYYNHKERDDRINRPKTKKFEARGAEINVSRPEVPTS